MIMNVDPVFMKQYMKHIEKQHKSSKITVNHDDEIHVNNVFTKDGFKEMGKIISNCLKCICTLPCKNYRV